MKFDPISKSFFHNRGNPLDCDYLIIDEASMIDTSLASSLFEAIPHKSHLLLVGDSDQLPSVGAGNILSDLKQCSHSSVVKLEKVYRQAAESQIIRSAHNILSGINKPLSSLSSLRYLDKKNDFNFIEVEDDIQMLKAIIFLNKEYLPKLYSLNPIEDIQVLSPMHKGKEGSSP